MNDNNRKPSLRTAVMLVVAFVAAVTLTMWTCRDSGAPTERALFWGIVLPWSAVARIPGSRLGDCLGLVGRHALGWFAAVMGGIVVVLVLNYLQEPDFMLMIVRLRTTLMPPAVIFGILSATIAESSLSMLEMLWPADISSERDA
jgi:hypothetical protein